MAKRGMKTRTETITTKSTTSKIFAQNVKNGIIPGSYYDFSLYDCMLSFASLNSNEILIIDYLVHAPENRAIFNNMNEFARTIGGNEGCHTALRKSLWRLGALALVIIKMPADKIIIELSPIWKERLMIEFYYGFNSLGNKENVDSYEQLAEEIYKAQVSRHKKANKKKMEDAQNDDRNCD